ncbi:MAG: hypothetical protein B6230_07140 [Desulfobacteraceae bacterium 4572_89]|nr:MAG: hypothetical protein B6230_07140 [Desulfobacteraceae bacterium 4572_89]
MKAIKSIVPVMVLLLVTSFMSQAFADEYSQTISIFKNSEAVQPFFDNSFGYAVFPTVGKGGLVLGGAYGKGQVYKQKKLTGKITLSKISIGFQLGGQAFSEIIFLQDQRAYDEDINYTKGMAVFVHTKGGLMYEAAIGGQKFEFTPL